VDEWQNGHEVRAVMTSGRAVAVVAGVAVALRVVYAVALAWFSGYEWLANRYGPDMRLAAVANLILVAVVVAALVAGVPRLAWLAFAGALATAAMPGAAEGLLSTQLLPWVAATSVAAMLLIASRCGRTDLVVAAAITAVFGGLVVSNWAWSSLEYAVAGLAVLLACSTVMLLASTRSDRRASSMPSADEARLRQGERT
jgi:hypothetical protein